MADDNVSKQVVFQRVRNRIIEYFEVASSFDEQQKYQKAVPLVSVPSEMINQFEDWVPNKDVLDDFGLPVFSMAEQVALRRFHRIWEDVAQNTPNPLPSLVETLKLPKWKQLREAAEETLVVFLDRGKLSEDKEIEI
ncbi:MAG: hypothetical protein H6652_24600 [Ardenticatenaceae bacterium]|nr:hypothetical protein [Ardenticatenaceae bacterium]